MDVEQAMQIDLGSAERCDVAEAWALLAAEVQRLNEELELSTLRVATMCADNAKHQAEVQRLRALLANLAKRHEWDPHFDDGCRCEFHEQVRELFDGVIK